jgi:cytokinesis protein
MKEARRKAEQLQVFLEDMQKSYDDIMAFYGEDPTDDSSRRDFFAKLANFVQEWKVSLLISIQVSAILTAFPEIQGQEHRSRGPTSPQRNLHAPQTSSDFRKPPIS